ncbi:MAG: helix-turn-helix domain-containing protein [Chloroflexota bacterium]
MRVAGTSPEDLLTTGEVAAILGTTAMHVVKLCDRGQLPYTLAGTHRRIRRADVEALRTRGAGTNGGPMTADQVRSLWLGRVVAGKIAQDPDRALHHGRERLALLLSSDMDGRSWLLRWQQIIGQGPEAVMRVLTSTDPEARELRANSPFGGLLGDAERRRVIESFSRTRSRGNGS